MCVTSHLKTTTLNKNIYWNADILSFQFAYTYLVICIKRMYLGNHLFTLQTPVLNIQVINTDKDGYIILRF